MGQVPLILAETPNTYLVGVHELSTVCGGGVLLLILA